MAERLKVLTYNIHRGLSAFRRINVLEKIARVLDESNADIVCLQEVWGEPGMTEPNLELLCRDVWKHTSFGKNVVFDHGFQGNAILSRLPILKSKVVDLSVQGKEPRGCLIAEIGLPGHNKKLAVINQHFGLNQGERNMQLDKLIAFFPAEIQPDWPIVMGGDFNDWRRKISRSLNQKLGLLEAHRQCTGAYARTYPSIFPFFHLDRLYFRNCRPVHARVYAELRWKWLSDHLPLEAHFSL